MQRWRMKAWNCAEAIAVAACESGRDMSGRLDGPWATNGNHYGIFQISYVHAPNFPGFYENWMDPVFNIEVAFCDLVRAGLASVVLPPVLTRRLQYPYLGTTKHHLSAAHYR
jgi:hypothetical protein